MTQKIVFSTWLPDLVAKFEPSISFENQLGPGVGCMLPARYPTKLGKRAISSGLIDNGRNGRKTAIIAHSNNDCKRRLVQL